MDDSGAPNGDKASCMRQVLLLFRDIDQQHLDEVAEQHQFCPTATIAAILDQQEQGHQYPRRKGTLKRKRAVEDVDEDGDEDDEDDEEDGGGEVGGSSRSVKAKVDGPRTPSKAYTEMATKLLCQDFRNAPKPTVKKAMLPAHGNSLFKTYMTMDQETRNWNQDNPRWIPKKSLTKVEAAFLRSKIENIDRSAFDEAECLALDDFLAARRVKDEQDAEDLNLEQAKENGAVQDCGCCFEEFPLNRMVHCEGNVVHWFCRKCMRQQAETVIGQGQHTITCLSMDACSAGYSHTQRKTFLDKKLQVALDRNEAQAALQAVGIENLETCPFCPMAMEYPPVAENKEFHCTNPRCEVVSCRLCRKRTHLPQTCAEAADEGESARHAIEEAMSDAIIRKCNKCSQPYIKTDGCNKIRCTRCGTLQCYVCKTTVDDYTHFNDSTRGGKEGQCPLFDQNVSLEQRHQNEVKNAEEASRNRIVKDNPNLTEKALKINVSAQIEKEEKERLEKANIRSAVYRHDEALLGRYRHGNAAAAFRRGGGRFVPAAPAQPALAGGAAHVQYPGPPQVFPQRAVQQPAIQRLAAQQPAVQQQPAQQAIPQAVQQAAVQQAAVEQAAVQQQAVQQQAVQQQAVQQQGAHQRAVDQYAHYAHALQQRQQAYQQRQQIYQQRQEALQQVAQQQGAQQLRLAQQQLDDLVQQNQRNLLKTQAALMKYQNRPRAVPEAPRGNVAPVVASINAPPVAARRHPKPGQNAANPIVLDTIPERAVRGVISQLSADLLHFKRAMPGADQGSVGPAGNQVERYQPPRPNRYVNVPNHIQGGPNVRAQGAPSPPAAIRLPVAQAQPAAAQPDGGSIPRRVRFVT